MQMRGAISLVLFIFLRCHLGSAIDCYMCTGECKDKNTVTCGTDELCMTQNFQSNRLYGCQHSQYCKASTSNPDVVLTCCDKDLCNKPPEVTANTANTANTVNTGNTGNAANDASRDTPMQCYMCDYPCIEKHKATCQSQEVCFTKSFKIAGAPYHKRGCSNTTVCDKEAPETIAGTTVSVKTQCCNSNLCNSAAHLEVPAVALLAAIVAAWISKQC
ncbi:uncharacterized protein [Dendropsophus ebraccatus]|uniref:uncharacterized protein n=1 Tax=Dendropsophus ebraccatus TaxID=150705 RepID=UPI0038322BF9